MPEKWKGDRLWLVLSATTGLAVDVTLNKYSSSLPWWGVLCVWAIPAILFIIWAWKAERTTGWVRSRFLEHPVSYVLMVSLCIPIFWYSTREMVSRLRRRPSAPPPAQQSIPRNGVPPPSSAAPKGNVPVQLHAVLEPRRRGERPAQSAQNNHKPAGPLTQQNSGGCNQQVVGGSNNTNNCAPPLRLLSQANLQAFNDVLSSASTKGMVRVVMASSADDVFPLSQQICAALREAQWGSACPTMRSSVMGHEASATGLQCYSDNWSDPDSDVFKRAMNAAHLNCNYIPQPYDFGGIVIGGKGGVTILIGRPEGSS